jgi:hypothetical protein
LTAPHVGKSVAWTSRRKNENFYSQRTTVWILRKNGVLITQTCTLGVNQPLKNWNVISNFVIGIETAPIVPQEGNAAERSVLKALL